MYHKLHIFLPVFFCVFFFCTPQPFAEEAPKAPCDIKDALCVLEQLETTAGEIENVSWRDQTLRELAKSYTKEYKIDRAIALIDRIETPDTKAMTIRGIGMEAAQLSLPRAQYAAIFQALRAEAEKITHPPSYAIALTYIAMAQAFAGDNEGAWKTASEMENDALRHKAYGETAEIQAEQGNFESAMTSIGRIESESYRDKAYHTVSNILADRGMYAESYNAALLVTNAYKKTQAIQYLYDRKKETQQKGLSP